ncbi:hypothetical protein [uncultured Ruegeria sp.]|uniref:hypothetical protein n=1 Tax=uncultured Ruegeria sp. TaxID=259304 RepID=UPI00262BC097|nr:hypothetical protein [uncultured Ruegeria sp.]
MTFSILTKVYGDFWLRWFKAIYDGRPMPRELSGLIASTLSDQDWESGPAHVAREIEKNEALFSVRQSLSELYKDRAAVFCSSRLGISGNNSPEEVELPSSIQDNYAIIWATVDEIAGQAEAEEPNKSLVLSALKKLTEALNSCLSWVGQKADLAADTLIKWSIAARALTRLLVHQSVCVFTSSNSTLKVMLSLSN